MVWIDEFSIPNMVINPAFTLSDDLEQMVTFARSTLERNRECREVSAFGPDDLLHLFPSQEDPSFFSFGKLTGRREGALLQVDDLKGGHRMVPQNEIHVFHWLAIGVEVFIHVNLSPPSESQSTFGFIEVCVLDFVVNGFDDFQTRLWCWDPSKRHLVSNRKFPIKDLFLSRSDIQLMFPPNGIVGEVPPA